MCRRTICNLTSEENSLRESLEQERNNQNMYVNVIVSDMKNVFSYLPDIQCFYWFA